MYCRGFSFDLVTRVWDVFFSEGYKIVYRVALALVKVILSDIILFGTSFILSEPSLCSALLYTSVLLYFYTSVLLYFCTSTLLYFCTPVLRSFCVTLLSSTLLYLSRLHAPIRLYSTLLCFVTYNHVPTLLGFILHCDEENCSICCHVLHRSLLFTLHLFWCQCMAHRIAFYFVRNQATRHSCLIRLDLFSSKLKYVAWCLSINNLQWRHHFLTYFLSFSLSFFLSFSFLPSFLPSLLSFLPSSLPSLSYSHFLPPSYPSLLPPSIISFLSLEPSSIPYLLLIFISPSIMSF